MSAAPRLDHAAQDLVGGELLSKRYCPAPRYWKEKPPTAEIDEVARGSFKRKEPSEIRGLGHGALARSGALDL